MNRRLLLQLPFLGPLLTSKDVNKPVIVDNNVRVDQHKFDLLEKQILSHETSITYAPRAWGKTTFVKQLAIKLANKGKRVLIFSPHTYGARVVTYADNITIINSTLLDDKVRGMKPFDYLLMDEPGWRESYTDVHYTMWTTKNVHIITTKNTLKDGNYINLLADPITGKYSPRQFHLINIES